MWHKNYDRQWVRANQGLIINSSHPHPQAQESKNKLCGDKGDFLENEYLEYEKKEKQK